MRAKPGNYDALALDWPWSKQVWGRIAHLISMPNGEEERNTVLATSCPMGVVEGKEEEDLPTGSSVLRLFRY